MITLHKKCDTEEAAEQLSSRYRSEGAAGLAPTDEAFFFCAAGLVAAGLSAARLWRLIEKRTGWMYPGYDGTLKPAAWTPVDRHYEQLRITMQKLFSDLAIDTPAAA